MSVTPLLAVRADGGTGMGVGHLARSLGLVQAWRDRHGKAVLVTRDVPQFWADQFVAEDCEVVAGAPREKAHWWAVDGYHLGGTWAAPAGARMLLVDDHNTAATDGAGAELVVDQNLCASGSRYSGARAVLAGPRYALLRREVHAGRSETSVASTTRRIVVVFGGAPRGEVRALGEAVAADRRLRHLEVRILSGTDDLVGELATADAAVAAAGTVSWELCCLGVPSVLVAVAPNQEPVAANLARAGAAIQAPPAAEQVVAALLRLTADAPLRAHMGAIGRSLVDGLGARRVVCRLRAALLSLRGAKEGDARRLHEWRNEPAMRAASFSPEPVPWDAHIMWLRDRLARSTSAIYIASDSWGDVGVVRFDEDGSGVAEVSVTVAKERRGEGWGGALVDAGCRRLATERGTTRIDARIKAGNEASIRAFIDADFDRVPGDDPEVLRYARQTDGQERRARTEPRSAPR